MSVIRITRKTSGIVEYLLYGRKKGEELTRDERDIVTPVYGNLKELRKAINYLEKNKNYKHNYMHITHSYSADDMEKISKMSDTQKTEFKREIVASIVKHHTSGYNIDDIVAYSETHYPKTKTEIDRLTGEIKDKYEHEHIVIVLHDKISDTQLQTPFSKTTYMDSVFQARNNTKYGLSHPKKIGSEKGKTYSENGKTIVPHSKEFYELELKDIKTFDKLQSYLKKNNIEYKEVKTKKNNYIKIINKNIKSDTKLNDVNLNTKHFKHLEYVTQNKTKVSPEELMPTFKQNNQYPEYMELEQLESILSEHYKSRMAIVENRNSKKTKALLQEIFEKDIDKEQGKSQENVIYASYQDKLFQTHYKHLTTVNLKGYSIDVNNDKEQTFKHKEKDIHVVDKGDRISSESSGKSLEEEVTLMLDIAEAKGWRLSTLNVKGNEEFKEEIQKQIGQRLRVQRDKYEKILLQGEGKTKKFEPAKVKGQVRPQTPLEDLTKKHKDYLKVKDIPLKELKEKLQAERVLAHSIEKYRLNAEQYEVTPDNKINNIGNRAKPKNVIDFLQKEIGITTKEAIEECQELLSSQPMPVQVQDKLVPVQIKLNKGITDEQQLNTEIYKPSYSADYQRERYSKSDMRKLSDFDMVHRGRSKSELLLSRDERDSLQQEGKRDNGLQSATNRNNEDGRTSEKSGRKEKGEIDMRLSIKSGRTWKEKDIDGFADLTVAVQQETYAMADFNKENSFHDVLIFDMDNRNTGSRVISYADAIQVLTEKNVQAFVIPTKEFDKDENQHYRVIVPVSKAIDKDTDKEVFTEIMTQTAKSLGLYDGASKSALASPTKYYEPSGMLFRGKVIGSPKTLDIDNIKERAVQTVENNRHQIQAKADKMAEIQDNIKRYRVVPFDTTTKETDLYSIDTKGIINTPIATLIAKYERGTEKPKDQGEYKTLDTKEASYAITNNIAHDFKSGNTYNSLQYLQMQYETNNTNRIARQLKLDMGQDFIKPNTDAIQTSLVKAMATATNDKGLEGILRDDFKADYAKLGKDTLIIGKIEVKLEDLGTAKKDIVSALIENREKAQEQQKEIEKPKENNKGIER